MTAPAGVDGRIALRFARRGGRTVLVHSRVEAPMAIVRPFALADGGAVVQLITVGPGLCGGDRLQIGVTAEEGTRVVVTTTAATRIMSMDRDRHAEQHVTLSAAAGASLEYYPAIAIPFPASALIQQVQVTADPAARVGVLESWALGRIARGEYLAFRRISSRTSLVVGGVLKYMDATCMDPADGDLAGAGVLAGHRYLASAFWYGVDLPQGAWAGGEDAGTLSAFAQSSPGLLYLRALSACGPGLGAVVRQSLDIIAAAWGVAAVRLDRFQL